MTSTFTVTNTLTFTRLQLLKMQVEIAMRRVGGVSESFQKAIQEGINRRWIGKVSFYGLDSAKRCRAQLDLRIDWATHELEMSRGHATVTIDGSWTQSTAVEVDAALRLFNQYLRENALGAVSRVSYAPGVDHDLADRTLGLKTAEPLSWASGPRAGTQVGVPELDELRVGLELLE